MKFKAVNELEHFSFRDAQIEKAEWTDDALRFELEAVIVKANNKVKAADDPEKMLQELGE